MWRALKKRKLTINMRVATLIAAGHDAQAQQDWSDFLISVGENSFGPEGAKFVVPEDMLHKSNDPRDLVHDVFGDIKNDPACRTPEHLQKRAILTSKNTDVDGINHICIEGWPGNVFTSLSSDQTVEIDEASLYPTEFLNSLRPQGMPSHCVQLKKGMPFILLRNLNAAQGLANGTRLSCTSFPGSGRVIQARVLTGPKAGNEVLIPRIKLIPSTKELPFNFSRLQFPIRPCFAMSINKDQGQTLERVGIFLPTPVFSHGQFYVALSRSGQRSGISIMLPEGNTTANVVWKDVLGD